MKLIGNDSLQNEKNPNIKSNEIRKADKERWNYGWREREWARPVSGGSGGSGDSAGSGGCAEADPAADWWLRFWYRELQSPWPP